METLYTYNDTHGPEFVIKLDIGRSYRCFSLSDPDLYKTCTTHLRTELPYYTYTVIATADRFTPDLVKDLFPEHFI